VSEGSVRTQIEGASTPYPSQETTKHPGVVYRHWLGLLLALGLTAGAFYFAVRGIDTAALWRRVASQNHSLIIVAALLLVVQIVFGAERWRTILKMLMPDRRVPLVGVQAAFYTAAFFNCFPLGNIGGDIARVVLSRQLTLPFDRIITSVLVDHALALVAIFAVAALTLPTISHPLASAAWFGSVAILLAVVAGAYLLWIFEYALGRWRHHRLVGTFLALTAQLESLRQPRMLVALLWGLLSVGASALSTYFLSRALGIAVGPAAMAAVMSMVTLVVIMPISLAGWGVREVSFVALLGTLGVEADAAFLLSVEVGLLTMVMSLPGAGLWLLTRQRTDMAVAG